MNEVLIYFKETREISKVIDLETNQEIRWSSVLRDDSDE